jgi:beta-ribofuranosylaminobenzene 5'-phosphate synthase
MAACPKAGMVTVETGARLHFGFQNLALAHERLYGGVGVALGSPRIAVTAEPASGVTCGDPAVEPFVEDAVAAVGVDGARVSVGERFDRHVGFGSGTQLALATLVAVARAHDEYADARTVAPELGRGGRSGVGVATFENGGFVVDAGHPTERFTSSPPAEGTWDVPKPMVRHDLPSSWRFVLVTPDDATGQSGEAEDQSMRSAVERADPGIADDISHLLTRRLLPAIAERDIAEFGAAVARLGRLNGAWYADEQGGVYRPPAGELIDTLGDNPVVYGAGQSSWGPTVYGVTRAETTDEATAAARSALDEADTPGAVEVAAPRNRGAVLDDS